MKQSEKLENDMWHAREFISCALADLSDKEEPGDGWLFEYLKTTLDTARRCIDLAQRVYEHLTKEHGDESDGH